MSRYRLLRSWPLRSRATGLVALLALLATPGGLPGCVMSLVDATRHCAPRAQHAHNLHTMTVTPASVEPTVLPVMQHDCHGLSAALRCGSTITCCTAQPSAVAALAVAPVVPAARLDLIALDSRSRASFLAPPSPPPPRV